MNPQKRTHISVDANGETAAGSPGADNGADGPDSTAWILRSASVNVLLSSSIARRAAASSGNLFRYDAEGDQYLFNWGTKGLTAGTYELTIDLGDGESRKVRVDLR